MSKEVSKRLVLLVEDDPFLHKVLSARLKEEGMNVAVAVDGEAALIDIAKLKPTLVLLDLILPKKSGFEVLTELRKHPATEKLAVMVLSNLGQQEDIDQIRKLGVHEYLVKADYALSDIVKKVQQHLATIV